MKIGSETIVLITGGASGIGKLMGRMVLQKGAKLVIWDINRQSMEDAVAELSSLGAVFSYLVDVSSPEQIMETAKETMKVHGAIDLLINNAGVVVGKLFQDHSFADIAKTMSINANAPMYITLQFLPGMLARKSGHICNIASSAGLISNPRMSVYAASKWAAIGWSDSLRIEMQQIHSGVKVTTVTPYYINTGMFNGVRSSVIPILQPERAARKIIRGIEKDQIFVKMPLIIHFVRLCQAIFPIPLFDFLVGKVLGIYNTMKHFEGRKN